jgi:hypothetical protein
MMRRFNTIFIGLLLCLNASAPTASAQLWGYPRGYGGYGMGQWGGGNPNATYMAGLGSYARDQGVYQQEQAQADSVNLDTMIKWNRALRARQLALNEDKRKEAAKQQARQDVRVEKSDLKNGTTLNNLLIQVLDADPAASSSPVEQWPR